MTPRTIDVDLISMACERIGGILSLAENHIDMTIDLDTTQSIPLESAIYCARGLLDDIKAILNASEPNQPENSHEEA